MTDKPTQPAPPGPWTLQMPVGPRGVAAPPKAQPKAPQPAPAPTAPSSTPPAQPPAPAPTNGHHPTHNAATTYSTGASTLDREVGFIPAEPVPTSAPTPHVSHSDILSTPLSAPMLTPELEAALSQTQTARALPTAKEPAPPPCPVMPLPANIPAYVYDPEVRCPEDLIVAYGSYADGTELPREAHEWVMLNFIATMLNGQGNTFWNGSIPYSFDLWSIMLSTSGTGRSTLVGTGIELIRSLGMKIEHDSAWGSGMGMIQTFADQPWGLSIFGEFSVLASQLNKPNFGEAKQWLTDRYDAAYAPGTMKYRSTNRDTDTPEIVFCVPPRTNILCTSSVAWFTDNISEEDTTGGFIPRFILRHFAETICVPRPPKLDRERIPPILKGLYQISQLRGQSINLEDAPPAVQRLHDEWYLAADRRFRQHEKSSLAKPFWGRMRGWMLKFSLIYEVATSGRYEFTEHSMRRAIAAMDIIERDTNRALATGMTKIGASEESMFDLIYRSKVAGITKSELTKKFQTMKRHERRDCWLKLLDTERIVLFRRGGDAGRPAYLFVDARLEEAHAKATPGDDVVPDPQETVKKW